MRRKTGEVVVKLVTLAVLSSLGFVLKAFVRFPYPVAPWIFVEFSDAIVLVAYSLYGFFGAVFVAVIKTALDLAVNGLVGLGIGNLTELFTSLMFVFGLLITSHIFHWFKKDFKYRILSYIFIALLVGVVLVLLDAIFIMPSYLTVFGENARFSTCFEEGMIESVIGYLHNDLKVMNGYSSYIGIISAIYGPFNLLKAGLCCFVYEIIFRRLFIVLLRRSKLMKKYFYTTNRGKEIEKVLKAHLVDQLLDVKIPTEKQA